jgi:hypothetical protein
MCSYDQTVSEYLETHVAFWGIPEVSAVSSDYSVSTEVKIIEDYDRLEAANTITIISTPDDRFSCGQQLKVGVKQLIIASRHNDDYWISNCNCQPPSAYLIQYLRSGSDTYLPDLQRCWNNDTVKIKNNKVCKVWRNAPDDETTEWQEWNRLVEMAKSE